MYCLSNGTSTNDSEWAWRTPLLLRVTKRVARSLCICRASCLLSHNKASNAEASVSMQSPSIGCNDAFSDRFLWYTIVNVTFRTINSDRVLFQSMLAFYGDAYFLGCGRFMRMRKDTADTESILYRLSAAASNDCRIVDSQSLSSFHSNSMIALPCLSPTAFDLSGKSSKFTLTSRHPARRSPRDFAVGEQCTAPAVDERKHWFVDSLNGPAQCLHQKCLLP